MNELYSWAQSNSFPWESWEETRARYESMYGAVSEEDELSEDTENVNWDEDWLESQAPEKIKEEEGLLDWLPSPSEFGSAAAKSWDETQASGATIGETLVAPALDYLGFKETADDIKEWAPGYREEQLAEADQYDEVLSRKQKRLAEDPNYVPAETREETLSRLQAEGGLGYEVAKHVPEFLPLTTEKAIEDFPTAGEVGSFATGSAVPMVGAAAVALPALALGSGALVAGGLAMGTGALLSSALVSSETADNIKNNPVIRVALGIDDKTPFEKLPPTDQQLIKKVAEDGAQTNLGQRMISSGIPEMLGYIPAGGWLLRAVTDIAGGTASEVWDISVSRDSMVSALLENGVDESKVIELDAALQAIGPKKSEVFMKALVGEAVATGPITGAEQIIMSKLPKKMHYVDVGATTTEEIRKQQEKAEQDEIKGRQDQFKKASEEKRTAGELAERIVRLHNTDPDAATQDLQDYKLNDRQVQNNIQKILGAEHPKILEDMTRRIGNEDRQKESIKVLEKADNERQKLAEKDAKKVEDEAKTLKKEEDEKFKYVDAEEKVKAYEAGYAEQLDLKRTAEQIAIWDKVNRPLQAIKDLDVYNSSIEKEQKKAANKVKADAKAKEVDVKAKKTKTKTKTKKKAETTKVVTPDVEKEVETASNINDLAGRFERVRLNNQPGKSDKSYKFSPPESEMIGKPGSDKWLKFQEARKKYRETDSQYIQTNLDRLSEFVAKNPQDKGVLEGADLDFIKKNQKEFDSRLAEINKPVKEEVKTEYKVPNLEPILKKGNHEQVIEDAGGTGGDPATDKVEGGAKIPIELLYPRRKQRVEDIKGDYDEGMMNYEDYKEDLETIIWDDINDGKYAEDTDASDVWDNNDMDSVSVERFAKALVKQQKAQVKADKTTSKVKKKGDKKTSKSIQGRIFSMLSDSEYKGDPEYSLNKNETVKLVEKFKARTNLKGKDVDITTLSKNDKADQAMITELLGEESAQEVLDTAEGFEHSGKVYIVAENIEGTVKAAQDFQGTPQAKQSAGSRLINTLFHEILGHYGLKKLLGNSYNPFINRFIKLNKKMLDKYAVHGVGKDYIPESVSKISDPDERTDAYNNLKENQKTSVTNEVLRTEFIIAEEYIARNFAEFGARDPNIIKRIVVSLRNYVSSIPMFKDMGITTDQVKKIMAELQQEYIGGKRNFISGEDFKTLDSQLDTTEEEEAQAEAEAEPEEVTTEEVKEVETLTLTDETEETKILKSVKQSKALGLYAKYNKDAGVDGSLLLHKNTRPAEGKYRITFFRADGDLDTLRTKNGHEHFPTLKKAKDRLSEIGEGIQDITGGRAVNMSKKITQPTRETDSTLDYVQDKGMRGAEVDREYLELELRWLRAQEAKGKKLPISKEHEAAIRDVGLNFSLRTKSPPKKTIKAYKLLKMKARKQGEIFPLFIGRAKPVLMNQWLDAEFIPTKGFSPRPGWHLSDTPAALHIGTDKKVVDGKQKPTTRRDDEVWAEVEVADDVDWQPEADKRGRVYSKGHRLAGQPMPSSREIKDEIPVDGNYRYKTNPNMRGNWIIAGAVKVNRILSDAEVATINVKTGIADLPRKKPLDTKVYGINQSKIVSPLIEEAKKYKTADEFIKSQTKSYMSGHTAPWGEDAAPLHDMTQIYPDDIYSPQAVRYYGDGSSMDADSAEIIQEFRGNPEAEVTIYRAVPDDYSIKTINAGDWVTINEDYAIQHGRYFEESTETGETGAIILSKEVKAKEVFTDANSIHEFGYNPSEGGMLSNKGLTKIWKEANGQKVNLSKKTSPFDLVLEEAETDIDSVPFVKAAGKRREEAAKVKAMRKTNAERAGAAYRLDISDEAVNKYIESKAEEGLVGAMRLPNMSKIPKKYRGEVAVGMIADRLIRGSYIPYHGKKSKHAKNLKLNGGPMYAFDKKRNTGKGGRAAWASQKGPISKIYNAVMGQDTDGNIISNGANYGFIILGKEDMHMSNIDVWAVAYGEAMDAVEFSGADMALLDKNAQEAVERYAPRFKGKIKTFVELMELGKLNELQARGKYGKELTFEKRKPILEFMFKPTKAKANNLLNIEELSNRTSAYPDAKMGDLVGIIKFHKNKSNFKTTAEDLGIETHPSYKHILQGEGIYTFKKPIPVNEFARGWLMEKRRTYTKGKLTAVQTPFFKKGQTEFSSEKDVKIGETSYSNMFYSAELISWLTGQPVTSGKLHTDWKTAKTEYEAELEIQKDTLTEVELKEWRKNNKPPVRSVITEKPPRGGRYKSRGGVAATKAAVRSIELKAPLINIDPDMLINPIPAKDVTVNMSKKVGAVNAYKAAKVAQGRLTDEGLYWMPTFKLQDKLSNKLTRRLVSQGTLPDMELFKDIRRKNKGVVFQAQQAGEKLFTILSKSKQQKVLYDYFVTPNADASKIINKKERQSAKDAKAQIQLIGRALVEAGLMTQESLDKFDDQYLPRKYLKYLLREKDYRAIDQGGAGVNVDLGYIIGRKDIPKGIRELIMGEVKDPAFLSSIAISTPIRDLAILDMFEQIAVEGLNKKRNWVLPETLVKFDILGEMKKLTNGDNALIKELQLMDTEGVMISGHWLLNEAEKIRDRVDNHMILEPAKEKLVRKLVNVMMTKGNEITKGITLPKDFRRVPKGRKYGRLSGMAIRKEIFEDLFGWGSKGNTFDINDDGTIDASWAEKVLGTGGTFEQYNRIWKWSKVSANPPSWVRNFVSNLIFMSLGPVPLPRMPDLFFQALTDQIKTRYVQEFGTQREFDALNTHTKIADEMGLTSGGFSQAELKTIRNEFVSSKNRAGGSLGLLRIRDSFKKAASSFQRGTSDLYGGIDTLGKVMMVKYLMKSKGASKEVAASQAEKYLFDYSNPLPSVKYLRKSAFGAPFISYPSFVAPVLIETIVKRPWKFAPYILFAEYMKESFKGEQDISDEEYQAVMSTLSEYLHKRANEKGDLSLIPESVLPLANKDALNRAQIVDVGYFYPFGMFSEVFRQLNPFKEGGSEITGAMHTLGLMGSPLLNIAVTSLTGRDPFTDRQIHDELATPEQKYASWFNYAFNLTLPPMFHGISPVGGAHSPVGSNPNAGGFGAITRLYEAYSDKVGREGEPKFTKAQAWARMVGLNITPIAPFEARAKQVYFEAQKIKKLQRGINQKVGKAIQAKYTKNKIDELVKGEIETINRLVKNLNKRISKKLPASLKRSRMDLLKSREKHLKYLKTLKAS